MDPGASLTLFNESWYRQSGPDFDGDAFAHFSRFGWHEGRDPHPLFSVNFYLEQLAKPLDESENPLAHFVAFGARNGLNPHPLFDTTFYMSRYADSLEGLDPLTHYLLRGGAAQYDPHPLFATTYYLKTNPDVEASGINALFHYASHGSDEPHRQPHPLFDAQMYAERRGLAKNVNPLADFLLRLRRVSKLSPADDPECSAIVLNLNKSVLTLQCIVDALETQDARTLEIVVVDNGSRPDDFAFLAELIPPAVRLIRLSTNRYFGEGNNIGVEASRGRLLLFLNNDAFVERSTIRSLAAVLEEFPDAGAVGPKLIFPDGRIQEAGGLVSPDGTVTQRGKFLPTHRGWYPSTEPVDYISASCLLMRRTDFDRVAGFDLAWDPAYYEDVDICLKLLLLGKRTYYCGDATVTHIENATSSDSSHGLRLNTVVEVNREKFISRWYDFLASGRDRSRAKVTLPPPAGGGYKRPLSRLAVLYTPYPLYPGGGERYMLTLAQALSQHYRTVVITPERYSSYRFRTIAGELNLDLSSVELLSLAEIGTVASCDLFIAMGNQVLPPIRAIGRRKIFVCQFPFPMHANHVGSAWGTLEDYDRVIVYSQFAAQHFGERAKAISNRVPPITVLAPPVPTYYSASSPKRVLGNILSVGRFTLEGHCKRQDTMIDAFKLLVERSGREDLELNLVGTVPPEPQARDYLRDLRERARDFRVQFHLSVPLAALGDLYQRASLYWHATGYMVWEKFFPERLEHFGISVVEAMSAGALPLVCANGGPAELVADGVTGFHWRSEAELAEKSLYALNLPTEQSERMRSEAQREARIFEPFKFESNFLALLEEGTLVAPQFFAFPVESPLAAGG